MKIKAIGFDFDGTLILSEQKKGQAMAEVFQKKFGIKQGVQKAYRELSGKSYNRQQKIEKLCIQFLKRQPHKQELKNIMKEFGQQYEKNLSSCPLIAGIEVIKELRKKVKFIFLLSLEDKKEVSKIARHCGIANYFDEILGGPIAKVKHLQHLCAKHHLKPSEILYVGDNHSDVTVSKKMNIPVILFGRKHFLGNHQEDTTADLRISSLKEIPSLIAKCI